MIVIERVPAKVCVTCGGQVFSDDVAEKIEKVRDGQAKGVHYAFVWAYDFDEIGQEPEEQEVRPTEDSIGTFAMTESGPTNFRGIGEPPEFTPTIRTDERIYV
jgi:hypothetical protein